jgi:hypothetical protein
MRRKQVSGVMNLAGLEDKNISQINATIIAGALVFLTISAVITSHMEIVKLGGLALGLGIVVSFSQSYMFVFSGTREDAIRAMKKNGFKYLFIMTIIESAGLILQTSLTYFVK